ncbi:CreA family protein [Paraburkholderia caribensis]|uniref:CreA family protein n=2 Tax=Paraburkholderia caribensis TaxID=75105 RepID=UPI002ADE47EF|nr:CreA family protein [Paraburkholderia caribensis]
MAPGTNHRLTCVKLQWMARRSVVLEVCERSSGLTSAPNRVEENVMQRYLVLQRTLPIAVAICASLAAHGDELARISTHSQRYGGEVEISAYDDPLLKGVTCYLSRTHEDNQFGNPQTGSISQADASCHQVGKVSVTRQVPKQAAVFEESQDPIFKSSARDPRPRFRADGSALFYLHRK